MYFDIQESEKEFLRARDNYSQEFSRLSSSQIQGIENCSWLTVGDKVELVLLSLGIKLMTELTYETVQQKEKILSLLEPLPFIYKQFTNTKKNCWIQIFANSSVASYVTSRQIELSAGELGVLYGFPVTSIQAFLGFREQSKTKPDDILNYYLIGVQSAEFYDEERNYYERMWEQVRKVSPAIIRQAEKEFENKYIN